MQTSRRSVLKGGGKAFAAVATLPFLSSINPAQAQEDAELFALYERCRQLEQEHMAALNRYEEVSFPVRREHEKLWRAGPIYRYSWCRGFSKHPDADDIDPQLIKEARDEADRIDEEWAAKVAEAEKLAGVPALKKKSDDTYRVWQDTEDRFYDTRAQTPAGMVLKLTLEWSDRMRSEWRAKDPAHRIDYHPDAIPSILKDLERLSGVAT